MPGPYITLTQAREWPPDSAALLRFADHRAIMNLIIDALQGAPAGADYSTRVNQVLVVNDAGTDFTTADQVAGCEFGNKYVFSHKPKLVTSTVSVVLTDNDHAGALIHMINTSATTITMNVTGNPATGISSPFLCRVIRESGSAVVSFVFNEAIINRTPNGHTSVQPGRGVGVTMIGTDVYLDGFTDTGPLPVVDSLQGFTADGADYQRKVTARQFYTSDGAGIFGPVRI